MRLYTHTHTHSLEKTRGITLISLVITIIVLLILAGISITTLIGENGILVKTGVAKSETKKAQYQEILVLIETELRQEQAIEQLSSKEYIDRYETEINKEEILKEATKIRKDDNTLFIKTKEGWIYKVTDKEVSYIGNREEYPVPPNLQEAEIQFNYEPSGWTNKEVNVIITTKTEKFLLQYALEDPNQESSWKSYPSEGITMSENGDVYARLINELGETSAWATGNVSKIETTKPTIRITTGTITVSSINISVSASDTPSGLAKNDTYQYYLNGNLVQKTTENSYNFTGLSANTKYTIKVVVYDEAGNSEEQTTTPTTAKPPTVSDYKGGSIFSNTTIIRDNNRKASKNTRRI